VRDGDRAPIQERKVNTTAKRLRELIRERERRKANEKRPRIKEEKEKGSAFHCARRKRCLSKSKTVLSMQKTVNPRRRLIGRASEGIMVREAH